MIRRRTLLGAPLLLAGCDWRTAATYDGDWVGASHERGHRLQALSAAGSASGSAGGLSGGSPSGSAGDSATGSASHPVAASASQGALATPVVIKRCSLAIVGGGVAGLAAARSAMSAGVDDLRLFELEDDPGGNARGHLMGGLACPLGAHYLPLPGPDAHEVSELLHELGLLRSESGRTVADERHLCHSPQERLWVDGQWVDGLLPPADKGSTRERQYRQFAQLVADTSRRLRFTLPTHRAGWTPGHALLDNLSFANWLAAQGLDDTGLLWTLDYACRDDYGAGIHTVSAWAGLHYFASRHGFHAPGDETAEREAVFTWPEGNAWITRQLAAPLGERLQSGSVVLRVSAGKHQVQIDLWNAHSKQHERWLATQAVIALPLHVAARVVAEPSAALTTAAAQLSHAPWLVANLHLRTPLTDKPGAPPSWDNVLHTPGPLVKDETEPAESPAANPALGYVDAQHQSLRPTPGPTVLTAYWALGDGDRATVARQRQALLNDSWRNWSGRVVAELARAHPDLASKTARVDLMRYGHAMSIPMPGVRGSAALQALAQVQAGRLQFAHSDLAGYSVFEEAYTLGVAAGRAAAGRR
ncbi:MAG: NAD(P)-binding protein [Burkholderiales bacterium]|nr:NAD(P)-binding protein [Burkholderiales bacterium]